MISETLIKELLERFASLNNFEKAFFALTLTSTEKQALAWLVKTDSLKCELMAITGDTIEHINSFVDKFPIVHRQWVLDWMRDFAAAGMDMYTVTPSGERNWTMIQEHREKSSLRFADVFKAIEEMNARDIVRRWLE